MSNVAKLVFKQERAAKKACADCRFFLLDKSSPQWSKCIAFGGEYADRERRKINGRCTPDGIMWDPKPARRTLKQWWKDVIG